jgi:hypothetical protein
MKFCENWPIFAKIERRIFVSTPGIQFDEKTEVENLVRLSLLA